MCAYPSVLSSKRNQKLWLVSFHSNDMKSNAGLLFHPAKRKERGIMRIMIMINKLGYVLSVILHFIYNIEIHRITRIQSTETKLIQFIMMTIIGMVL